MCLLHWLVNTCTRRDPFPMVDVNDTFGEVVAYDRRIFAGEVLAMDMAVANITAAYKRNGLWKDTVLVFSELPLRVVTLAQFQICSCPLCSVVQQNCSVDCTRWHDLSEYAPSRQVHCYG